MGRAVIEGLWLRYQGMPVEEDGGRERRRRVLQTLVWFLLTSLTLSYSTHFLHQLSSFCPKF